MPKYSTHQYGLLPKSWIIQLCSYCWLSWEFIVCSFCIPGGSLALFLPNPSLCLDSDSVLSLWPPELCQLFRAFVIISKWHPFLQAHMILKQRPMHWTPRAICRVIVASTLLDSEHLWEVILGNRWSLTTLTLICEHHHFKSLTGGLPLFYARTQTLL